MLLYHAFFDVYKIMFYHEKENDFMRSYRYQFTLGTKVAETLGSFTTL